MCKQPPSLVNLEVMPLGPSSTPGKDGVGINIRFACVAGKSVSSSHAASGCNGEGEMLLGFKFSHGETAFWLPKGKR